MAEGFAVTIAVSALAILGATIAGVLVGLLAATRSYLLQKLTRSYTGLLRNLPQIAKLFFLYFVVGLRRLPAALSALVLLTARTKRIMIPALSAQFVALSKATSLVDAIGVMNSSAPSLSSTTRWARPIRWIS